MSWIHIVGNSVPGLLVEVMVARKCACGTNTRDLLEDFRCRHRRHSRYARSWKTLDTTIRIQESPSIVAAWNPQLVLVQFQLQNMVDRYWYYYPLLCRSSFQEYRRIAV